MVHRIFHWWTKPLVLEKGSTINKIELLDPAPYSLFGTVSALGFSN